jgi:hypothetical protein
MGAQLVMIKSESEQVQLDKFIDSIAEATFSGTWLGLSDQEKVIFFRRKQDQK